MNRRLTRARRASREMPGGSPAAAIASSAASTRAALAWESARRSRARWPAGSAMAGLYSGGALDGGEQAGAGLAGQAAELGGEDRIQGGPAAPGGGDRVLDAAAVLVAEAAEHLVVGEDEPAQGLDLFR